jgi:hypothetical protein
MIEWGEKNTCTPQEADLLHAMHSMLKKWIENDSPFYKEIWIESVQRMNSLIND